MSNFMRDINLRDTTRQMLRRQLWGVLNAIMARVSRAMLDRLLHHALVYSLKGDSYRMRDRLRVGAVGFD